MKIKNKIHIMEKRILKYVNKSPNPDLSYGNCDEMVIVVIVVSTCMRG